VSDVPSHKLSPEELKTFKKEQQLKQLLEKVEAEFSERAKVPSIWFGRLLTALVIAIFLDTTGWVAAFISGSFYAALAFFLQAVETVSIIGLAGLAIFGSVEAYRLQEAKKRVKEDFELNQV